MWDTEKNTEFFLSEANISNNYTILAKSDYSFIFLT